MIIQCSFFMIIALIMLVHTWLQRNLSKENTSKAVSLAGSCWDFDDSRGGDGFGVLGNQRRGDATLKPRWTPVEKIIALDTTVDGWNPAPVDMVNIPLFIGFHTSQVVQDFSHQQYVIKNISNLKWLMIGEPRPNMLLPNKIRWAIFLQNYSHSSAQSFVILWIILTLVFWSILGSLVTVLRGCPLSGAWKGAKELKVTKNSLHNWDQFWSYHQVPNCIS